MSDQSYSEVRYIVVKSGDAGRRLDNFLRSNLKHLPRAWFYRTIRKGEFRVNKKRAKPSYRVQLGDEIRVPPVCLKESVMVRQYRSEDLDWLAGCVLYEDDDLMIINKPSGVAVHGGTGVTFSLIGALRAWRSDVDFLELVHRLDQSTSGCLILAKQPTVLREMHRLLANGEVDKFYVALLKGDCDNFGTEGLCVNLSLQRYRLRSGERYVDVATGCDLGKSAQSVFYLMEQFLGCALVKVRLETGRTHQIRVHAASMGHPVAGDLKYGDLAFNGSLRSLGLNRLFLHASSVSFKLRAGRGSLGEKCVTVEAPLDKLLNDCLGKLALI